MKDYYVVGINHIDMAFVQREEAHEEMLDITLERVIAAMERNSDIHFSLEQAAHYRKLEKRRPDLFKKVKQLLKEGRMEFMGGMATTLETNFPDGECFVRNQGMGLRWVEEHLRVRPENGWLIDTFGINAQVPQIMKNFGLKHLFADRFGCNMRYDLFWDEGLDGSKILVLGKDCGCVNIFPDTQAFVFCCEPAHVDQLFEDADKLTGNLPKLVTYYIENEHVYSEYYQKLMEERNAKGGNWKHATYQEYVHALEEKGFEAPTFFGDLNPEFTGTFALRTPIRVENRKAEIALMDAEKWDALLAKTDKTTKEALENSWWDLFFGQFHDAFSGSHEDITYKNIMHKFAGIVETSASIQKAALQIKEKDRGIFCANPLPWARSEWVKKDEITYVKVEVPACGVKQYADLNQCKISTGSKEECRKEIRNEFLHLVLDEREGIKTLEDLQGNTFMKNVGDFLYAEQDKGGLQVELCEGSEVQALSGTVQISNAKKSEMGESITMSGSFPKMNWNRGRNKLDWEAEFSLRTDEKALRLKLTLDWNGEATRIRLRIQGVMADRDVFFEVPFGMVRRSPYRNRQTARGEWPAHRFAAMESGEMGLALINKGVAGVEQEENALATTLIRAYGDSESVWIKPTELSCQNGKQTFEFMIVPYMGTYADAGVVRMAQQYNQEIQIYQGESGLALEEESFFAIKEENLVLSTIKRTWDDTDELVVRIYETLGKQTKGNIFIKNLERAELSNMAEVPGTVLAHENEMLSLDFKPFEIKTIRIKRF